jgi:tRNA (guanosine-2'-O-)-methyltransferase
MTEEKKVKSKTSLRQRADHIKIGRCKNLIAVLEDPTDHTNIGTVIRNINALGVEKLYVIDRKNIVPDDWQDMREKKPLLKTSVSAVKWSFIKKFKSTEECLNHLEKNKFVSMVTSPYLKGKSNVILHKGKYTQKKLAVWFGTEAIGISDIALQRSEGCINIEMFGMVDSLNLATSTGIVLYEITVQRREFQNQKLKKQSNKV